MKHNKFLSILMTILLIFIFCQNISAEQIPLGKINTLVPPVTIIRADGQEITAEPGTLLFAGDQITTGENSMADFTIDNNGQFKLGEDAEVSIDELSDTETDQSVLNLVTGYMRSVFKNLKGEAVIHTPTAVIGVRGTEFDTVVSVDTSTVVAVDEGTVGIDTETATTMLAKGKMAQVDMEQKLSAAEQVIPIEKRNWKKWQKNKEEQFLKHLPQMLSQYRKQFENKAKQLTDISSEMNTTLNELAVKAGNEADLKQLKHLSKKMTADFRKKMNRFHASSRFAHRLEKLVAKNKSRFTPQELSLIKSDLNTISVKRKELKKMSKETVKHIKKSVKGLKKEIKKSKKDKNDKHKKDKPDKHKAKHKDKHKKDEKE